MIVTIVSATDHPSCTLYLKQGVLFESASPGAVVAVRTFGDYKHYPPCILSPQTAAFMIKTALWLGHNLIPKRWNMLSCPTCLLLSIKRQDDLLNAFCLTSGRGESVRESGF